MRYRAIVKQSEGWWIGWLIDLPGVNAQERTREALIEALKEGAREMLESEIPFQPEGSMTVIEVPDPEWSAKSKAA